MNQTIFFSSKLLVPMPQYTKGASCNWIDTFRASNGKNHETVDVIVFNTENKEEIKNIIASDLSQLKEIPETERSENVTNSIAFLEKTLSGIGTPGIEHDAPANLLNALYRASGKMLGADQVIYLSGVSSIC